MYLRRGVAQLRVLKGLCSVKHIRVTGVTAACNRRDRKDLRVQS